jgi:hypothetical protein
LRIRPRCEEIDDTGDSINDCFILRNSRWWTSLESTGELFLLCLLESREEPALMEQRAIRVSIRV